MPLMVTATVPGVADAEAVKVTRLVVAVGLVPKDAVTPLGKPEADNDTVPAKPFMGLTVMVLLPEFPCATVTPEGPAERLKSGNGADPGQLATRLATLMVPIPVAKSHPLAAANAGCSVELEVERTPVPSAES